jgi:hypothetical protein
MAIEKNLDDILEVVLICRYCRNPLRYNPKTQPEVPAWCQSPGCTNPIQRRFLAPGSPEMQRISNAKILIPLIFGLRTAKEEEAPFEIRFKFSDRSESL